MLTASSLKKFPFFANLEQTFIEKIYRHHITIELEKDEWLFHQGEKAKYLFVIISGKIALTLEFDEDNIQRLNPYMPGEVIGWSALVTPQLYTMGAITEAPSTVIGFLGEEVFMLMEQNPDQGYLLLKNLAEVMAERLTNRNIQLMSLRN